MPRRSTAQTIGRLFPPAYFALRSKLRRYRETRRSSVQVRQKRAQLDILARLARDRVVLDVGAHRGAYTLEVAPHAAQVHAFEPNPELVQLLEDLFSFAPWPVEVHGFALSDREDIADLRVPRQRPGSATLEAENLHVNALADTEEMAAFRVPTRRLDDLNLDRVDLIKIDVEGHQLPLLEGSRQTLNKCQPDIFIEIDETHRHGSIQAIDAWLEAAGYTGFFLIHPVLLPVRQFDVDAFHTRRDGQKGKVRINDFFYFHRDRLAAAKGRLEDITFAGSCGAEGFDVVTPR